MQNTVTQSDKRFGDLWWRVVPQFAARSSPVLSLILTDGSYLTAFPAIGALAPPASLLIGVLLGVLHPILGVTFTTSIPLIAFMLFFGSLGMALGAWLWLGYCVGDTLLFLVGIGYYGVWSGFRDRLLFGFIPSWISYILLAMLLILIPVVSQGLRAHILDFKMPAWVRIVVGAGLQLLFLAALVWAWTQATPALIRPLFTNDRYYWPPVEAIEPLQDTGMTLVYAVLIFGAVRILVELWASTRPAAQERAARRAALIRSASRRRFVLPGWLTAPMKAGLVTFLLAGIITGWSEAIAFLVFLIVVLEVREFVMHIAGWARRVTRIPLLLRLLIGLALSYVVGWISLTLLWSQTGTFLPLLLGTAASLLIFALLVPSPVARTPAPAVKVGK